MRFENGAVGTTPWDHTRRRILLNLSGYPHLYLHHSFCSWNVPEGYTTVMPLASFLLLTLGASPRSHNIHRIYLFVTWSLTDTAHGARGVLARRAPICCSVCQRLHYYERIGERPHRPVAAASAWRAFAELTLHCPGAVTFLPRHREVLCSEVQTAGAALVGVFGEAGCRLCAGTLGSCIWY